MVVKKKSTNAKKVVRKETGIPKVRIGEEPIPEEASAITLPEVIEAVREVKKNFFQQACDELGLDPDRDVAAWKETNEYISIVTKPTPFKKVWYKNRGLR